MDEDSHSHDSDSEDDSDDEYDLPPEFDELIGDESEDELDNIDGAGRVEEVDTDEEEAPKLVEAKKGKNKRAAEEAADGLDDLIAKEGKADSKLSKKQAKKLKNNEGKAVAAEKDTPKSEKKVQFAKNLEQGPTPSPADKAKKPAKSVWSEKGVTIDDRKVGTGRTAKVGDKVGMRYIGKLENGKIFDCKSFLSGVFRISNLDAKNKQQPTRRVLPSRSSWARARSLTAGTSVSRAWPLVVSAVSPFPQTRLTAARACLAFRPTAP